MVKRWDGLTGDPRFDSKNRILQRCNAKLIEVNKKCQTNIGNSHVEIAPG